MYDPVSIGIGASTLIGSGLGLWGASQQADAAKSAANTQADATKYAAQLQQQQYEQNRSDLAPWRQAGQQALGKLSDLAGQKAYQPGGLTSDQEYALMSSQLNVGGVSPSQAYAQATKQFQFDPNQDPSYQFRLKQGLGGVEESAAARGGFFSGGTGKALTDYAQGLASTEYQNAYQRDLTTKQADLGAYQTAYGDVLNQRNLQGSAYQTALGNEQSQRQQAWNELSGLAGTGQTAATQVGQWGMQNASQLGGLATSADGAQAAGQLGQASAWNTGLQNINNQFQSGLGQYMNYNQYQQGLQSNPWNQQMTQMNQQNQQSLNSLNYTL